MWKLLPMLQLFLMYLLHFTYNWIIYQHPTHLHKDDHISCK